MLLLGGGVSLLLLLMTVVGMTAAQSTRPFPHGALPVSPFQSWSTRSSTVSFFLGNISGMNSGAELTAEARLGVEMVEELERVV